MSSRRIKRQVLEIVSSADLYTALEKLSELPPRDIVNPLFSAICRSEERIRWHAISAMGPTVARIADDEMENARIIMRRIIWSLNDESGGIGWGAPESFAEIMVQHEGLTDEYVHMLISYMRQDGEELFQQGNFLEHEMLQRGLLWGIGRLASKKPDILREKGVIDDIIPYLSSNDGPIRGLAVRALGYLCAHKTKNLLVPLKFDNEPVRLYENGKFHTSSVAEMTSYATDNFDNCSLRGE